eukprot:6298012-Prymnesium_polylepis.1
MYRRVLGRLGLGDLAGSAGGAGLRCALSYILARLGGGAHPSTEHLAARGDDAARAVRPPP